MANDIVERLTAPTHFVGIGRLHAELIDLARDAAHEIEKLRYELECAAMEIRTLRNEGIAA